MLRVKGPKPLGACIRDAALGNQAGDQASRRHIESGIGGGAAMRRYLNRGDGAIFPQAGNSFLSNELSLAIMQF